jgi:hypothetical protein
MRNNNISKHIKYKCFVFKFIKATAEPLILNTWIMLQYDINIHAHKCHENVYAETKPTFCILGQQYTLCALDHGNSHCHVQIIHKHHY